jgi:hypothetical protein
MNVSRRRVLGGVCVAATGALTGCGDRGPGRTSTAVFLTNETDGELRATLRGYELPPDRDDPETAALEQVFVRRKTLSPEEDVSVPGGERPGSDLRLLVVTDRGPDGSYDWERVDQYSTTDVRIGQNAVRFTELD